MAAPFRNGADKTLQRAQSKSYERRPPSKLSTVLLMRNCKVRHYRPLLCGHTATHSKDTKHGLGRVLASACIRSVLLLTLSM